MNANPANDRQFFSQWVRATWAGWVLGVPLIVVMALFGEAVGIGGVQVLVGVGMGLGIGFMQGRVMRSVLQRVAPWFWSCVVGLGLPFLATDIAKAAGWNFAFSLYLAVALGGLIVGAWQAFLLQPYFQRAGWWVAVSVPGWALASGTAAAADKLTRLGPLRGLVGALAYLGIIAAGGLILGVITGIALVWLLRRKATT